MNSQINQPEISFDEGRHPRAKIGYIVLASEETCEDDIFRLTPDGVGAHINRIHASDEVSLDSAGQMKFALKDSALQLLPDYAIDVICFACSGATMVLGEQIVCDLLTEARPDAKAVTVLGAAKRALQALEAQKVVVLTPYPKAFEKYVRGYLQEAGSEVLVYESMELERNEDISRVTPEYLYRRANKLNDMDADAVFICCGALRSLEIIEQLEQKLNKPVVASNQAMMWDCLRQAGIEDRIKGYGKLFEL